jgi:hypothetical protein
MSTQLDQIVGKAKSNPKLRFTSLAHLITPEFLKETWKQMNRRGASGVDGETTKEFERDLDTRVQELCDCLKQGTYRAPPVRRVDSERPRQEVAARNSNCRGPSVAAICGTDLEALFEADSLNARMDFGLTHFVPAALRKIIVTKKLELVEADIRATLTTSSMTGCIRLLIDCNRPSCALSANGWRGTWWKESFYEPKKGHKGASPFYPSTTAFVLISG